MKCLAIIFALAALACIFILIVRVPKKAKTIFEGDARAITLPPIDPNASGGGAGGPSSPGYITVSTKSGGSGGPGKLFQPRKLIQIAIRPPYLIYALADDGTLWVNDFDPVASGRIFKGDWKQIDVRIPAKDPTAMEEFYK